MVESTNHTEVFSNKEKKNEFTGKGVKNVSSEVPVSALILDHCLDIKTTGLDVLLLCWTSEEV